MKINKAKNLTKQIICIIIVLMLCNFIIPNYSYAVSTEGGGSLLKVMAQFFCFIPDVVINYLQDMFTSPQKIEISEENYIIKYSPGIIFSGQVPAFDINFIDPMEKKEVTVKKPNNISIKDITTGDFGNVFSRLKENRIKSKGYYAIAKLPWGGDELAKEIDKIQKKYDYSFADYSGYVSSINYDNWHDEELSLDFIAPGTETKDNILWIYNNTLYFMVYYYWDQIAYYDFTYAIFKTTLTEAELQAFDEISTVVSTTPEYRESSSAILQPIIATWYNALRRIALVGLLSMLVYVGIKIVLTSTSAKDKAKYKKMLKDWLIALCILFTLHYLMSVTITVVEKINDILKASTIGARGEDVLMSTVRSEIASGGNWGIVLSYVVIYCVLAVYTVIFTIQYIKRAIYLAFLTMIAPLITLTYPLDKMKDSKAQAFDMWIKDYIFFTLIQVVHLLLYYIFLGSSMNLANKGNWLYAIVAIGFLTKAEKIVKKMFGFEKSKTMGAMAAGATGALVMNVINKLQNLGKGGSGGKGGSSKASHGQTGTATGVRTATINPLSALTAGNIGDILNESESVTSTAQGGSFKMSAGGDNTADGSSLGASMPSNTLPNASTGGANKSKKSTMSKASKKNNNSNLSQSELQKYKKPQRSIWNGTKAVFGRYTGPVVKSLLEGFTSGFTGATGALIGFSAGLSNGEMDDAFKGMAGGAVAGKTLGQAAVRKVTNIESPKKAIDEFRDTRREREVGEKQVKNDKFDRAFRQTQDYRNLQQNPNFSDEKVQQMLDAGITDQKRMDKILKNNAKHPRKYSMDRAIAYSQMAKTCKEEILYDNSKFLRYCNDKKIEIEEKDIKTLRKNIMDFK